MRALVCSPGALNRRVVVLCRVVLCCVVAGLSRSRQKTLTLEIERTVLNRTKSDGILLKRTESDGILLKRT